MKYAPLGSVSKGTLKSDKFTFISSNKYPADETIVAAIGDLIAALVNNGTISESDANMLLLVEKSQ